MPKDSGRARAVLLLDGLGCALAATAATLMIGAARPTAVALRTAAVINAGWMLVCIGTLVGPARAQLTPVGASLVLGTAAFDGVAGLQQWRMARGVESSGD